MSEDVKSVLSVLKKGEFTIKHHLHPNFKSTQFRKKKFVTATRTLCWIVKEAIEMIEAMESDE
jgi:hypothetical protein